MRVLLVEDTQDLAEAICDSFAKRGDPVDHATTLEAAADSLAVQDYEVIILDIGLPDGNGNDLLRSLRAAGKLTPILMLTARTKIEQRVKSLDEGADDYLTKPFDLRELHARVRVLSRRQSADRGAIAFGDLHYDPAGQSLTIGDASVLLTRRELSLLETLLASRGRVVSKERIYENMFSFNEDEVGVTAVEIYMARLRRKLEGSRVSIKTLRGLGYQMVMDA